MCSFSMAGGKRSGRKNLPPCNSFQNIEGTYFLPVGTCPLQLESAALKRDPSLENLAFTFVTVPVGNLEGFSSYVMLICLFIYYVSFPHHLLLKLLRFRLGSIAETGGRRAQSEQVGEGADLQTRGRLAQTPY